VTGKINRYTMRITVNKWSQKFLWICFCFADSVCEEGTQPGLSVIWSLAIISLIAGLAAYATTLWRIKVTYRKHN
jgi:hypothetical protein